MPGARPPEVDRLPEAPTQKDRSDLTLGPLSLGAVEEGRSPLAAPFSPLTAPRPPRGRYALERFCTKYQTIYPRRRIGLFKGEDVFPRSAVQELHTADVWYRHNREVRSLLTVTTGRCALSVGWQVPYLGTRARGREGRASCELLTAIAATARCAPARRSAPRSA